MVLFRQLVGLAAASAGWVGTTRLIWSVPPRFPQLKPSPQTAWRGFSLPKQSTHDFDENCCAQVEAFVHVCHDSRKLRFLFDWNGGALTKLEWRWERAGINLRWHGHEKENILLPHLRRHADSLKQQPGIVQEMTDI
eukprot:212238-Amphidinium_carterae.1